MPNGFWQKYKKSKKEREKKNANLHLDLNPRPLAYKANSLTTRLTWQVSVQDAKVCAQQCMFSHFIRNGCMTTTSSSR